MRTGLASLMSESAASVARECLERASERSTSEPWIDVAVYRWLTTKVNERDTREYNLGVLKQHQSSDTYRPKIWLLTRAESAGMASLERLGYTEPLSMA